MSITIKKINHTNTKTHDYAIEMHNLTKTFLGGKIVANSDKTNIFIYPPYKIQTIDKLITNFHLPKSTLLMLVSAFAGREFILDTYKHAVDEKYRFFSYGDCMFIE